MILNETSYFGTGCRKNIAVEAARRGYKKAFFVTDKDLIRFHVADKVTEVFEQNNIPYEVYSDVKANPTIANVQNGVAAFKASGADFIVALGGGSAIDTAKGIGIVANNPEFADVKSLEGVVDTHNKAVPTFALPTTAGTVLPPHSSWSYARRTRKLAARVSQSSTSSFIAPVTASSVRSTARITRLPPRRFTFFK